MQVLITGSRGQLGRALQQRLPAAVGVDLPEVDITRLDSVEAALRAARPEVVFHCAAYTDVDGAARDPETTYRVNGLGTQNVALVYLSTNEVFDGAASY